MIVMIAVGCLAFGLICLLCGVVFGFLCREQVDANDAENYVSE